MNGTPLLLDVDSVIVLKHVPSSIGAFFSDLGRKIRVDPEE